jgi:SAM-dependent methyltransferase
MFPSINGRMTSELWRDDVQHDKIGRRGVNWENAVRQLKSDPEQQELVLACYYDDPLLDAAQRFFVSGEWKATRALIGTAGGKALELGAGRGIASYALARDGWQTTALEPDPSDEVGAGAIASLARESGFDIEVVSARGEEMPFASNSFDIVYGRAVLHHAQDLSQLCSEAARVLKPGGKFLAVREHVISRRSDLQQFLDSHPLHRLYGGENAFLLDEYTQAIRGAGLRLHSVLNPFASPINYYPATREQIREIIARRLHFPAALVPDWSLALAGRALDSPGRLYAFVAFKNGEPDA